MNLEQVFYVFGVIYLGFWSLVGIGLVVGAVVLYQRYQQLKRRMKQTVENKTSVLLGVTGLVKALGVKRIIPLVGLVPLAVKLYQSWLSNSQAGDKT